MNEAETRAEYIDPALAEAGWGVVDGSRVRREYMVAPGRIEGAGLPSRTEIADYVLFYKNTPLAVVEAKAFNKHVTEGLGQAKNYCSKMKVRWAYSTNGQTLYRADMLKGAEGAVDGYPTPEELWEATFAEEDAWFDRFVDVPSPDKGMGWGQRYYQEIAVRRVLESIADGKDRILLTLATGTGKTSIAFQIAWKLFQTRWNLNRDGERRPRILFLADRNILANQAFLEFTSFNVFEDDALVRIAPGEIRKKNRVPKNGSVFFTIFQTFMSGPDGAPYFGEYPPDFFDFVVVDECHRGGANDESSWRDILEHFSPAVQLGLTATPKRRDNVDTYKYFGEPVYSYSLKEGINDGFLTPFRVKRMQSTIDEYVYSPDDEVLEGDVDDRKIYKESDFNRIIEIEEREKSRVQTLLHSIGSRDKTLVFCANQAHALTVRDLINQYTTSRDPGYCTRVTANDGALGEQYLKEFQDNEKTIPTVLTTSYKLSTGVDARNVRNIVLMRPIRTMIEFKQIIGRGTRLFDGKTYFTIYDFVKAYEHFADPEWDGEPQADEGEIIIDPPVDLPLPPEE
ncbi:MAG: DEAD/DEAH box helicase family protein, partial [bacterium]|nr:DEAD/DEAH box helicase family protein [bacterium]